MDQLKSYQQVLWDKINQGGFKRGEMPIFMSGRQTGKSALNALYGRLWEDVLNRPVEELVLSEGRFHGARFYCVEPIGGNWMDMEAWCIKSFGDPASVWDLKRTGEQFIWPEEGRWYKNDRKFWFRNERDRTMFIMRWSSK
jgi:hypothetical protein